jgi:glycosyltransferase involved in cell wall biosynthesis
LVDLCRQEDGFAESVELILAGRIDEEVTEAFRQPPCGQITRFVGYLDHRESLRLLRRADLCLLFVGKEKAVRGMLTGKLFEYLGSGTPILALAPEGEAAEMIDRCSAGTTFHPDDVESLREWLRAAWRRFRSGQRGFGVANQAEISKLTRRHLTGELAALLREVCEEHSGAC